MLPKGAQGRVWRQAGTINQKVLREVNEANVGPNVVIVFKTVGKGTAKAVYGLTKGETSKAYASSTYRHHPLARASADTSRKHHVANDDVTAAAASSNRR